MVNESIPIVHKLGHKKGKIHDYDIYNKDIPVTSKKEVVNVFDLGYLLVQKLTFQSKYHHYHTVEEKPTKEFFQEGKKSEHNQSHSRIRIVIERAICRFKKFSKILAADVFINKLCRKYNKVSDIVSGIVNYLLMKQHH